MKLNILRIQDPAIGHDFIRGGLENVDSVDVLDKYTVRINAKVPDAALPISIALPDYPDGSGRLRHVRRTPHWHGSLQVRLLDTLERHSAEHAENYWETDAEGHSLPYLAEIVAKPKREDSVRMTALRTGQVQLIDDMAQGDVARFMKEHGAKYNTWKWHSGGNYIVFNWRRGVFQDKRVRTAAAHATDRTALHQAVYYEQGEILQCYPKDPGIWRASAAWGYPSRADKAKALLKGSMRQSAPPSRSSLT